MESFSARIDKAIAKAKVRIAAKYNISLETIEAILKKQDAKINKELSEIVDEKKEELLELASKKAVEETISSEIDKQVELQVEPEPVVAEMDEKESDAKDKSALVLHYHTHTLPIILPCISFKNSTHIPWCIFFNSKKFCNTQKTYLSDNKKTNLPPMQLSQ